MDIAGCVAVAKNSTRSFPQWMTSGKKHDQGDGNHLNEFNLATRAGSR